MKAPQFSGTWVLLLTALSCMAAPQGQDNWPPNPGYHSTIPAGYSVIQLRPSGAVLSLLGLVECPEIEGAQQIAQGLAGRVILPDGELLRRFPRHFSFRVTASLRKMVIDGPSDSANTSDDPAQFIMKLRFKLRAYNGLDVREISPESVTMIGMPPDIPYDERVYRVAFDVGERPVSERVVLEVYSPEGERLSRFHFELL